MIKSAVDRVVLEALEKGDHKAFEMVFKVYYEKVLNFVNGFIKSREDAEELTEDIFVGLWERHTSIDTQRSFDSWLFTIARNASLNFLKHKLIQTSYQTGLTPELSYSSEEELIAKELELFIRMQVERMPEQRKQIYILSKEKGLNNQEIADYLQTTKRNVESQLSLALSEIRKSIITALFTLI